MIEIETWQMFGGLLGILVLLGGGAMALQRLGIITKSNAAAAPATKGNSDADDLAARISALETRTAVLEERTHHHDREIGGIAETHTRISVLAETTSRIEGEIGQMNRQLGLVVKHLLDGRAP